MNRGVGAAGIFALMLAALLILSVSCIFFDFRMTGASPETQVKAIFTTSDISNPTEIREALGN